MGTNHVLHMSPHNCVCGSRLYWDNLIDAGMFYICIDYFPVSQNITAVSVYF